MKRRRTLWIVAVLGVPVGLFVSLALAVGFRPHLHLGLTWQGFRQVEEQGLIVRIVDRSRSSDDARLDVGRLGALGTVSRRHELDVSAHVSVHSDNAYVINITEEDSNLYYWEVSITLHHGESDYLPTAARATVYLMSSWPHESSRATGLILLKSTNWDGREPLHVEFALHTDELRGDQCFRGSCVVDWPD